MGVAAVDFANDYQKSPGVRRLHRPRPLRRRRVLRSADSAAEQGQRLGRVRVVAFQLLELAVEPGAQAWVVAPAPGEWMLTTAAARRSRLIASSSSDWSHARLGIALSAATTE
jgi:hypothetical protein